MGKALLVTCVIALFVGSLAAYKQECAVGPQYWCQSFQNAQDCGALHHCTETVWRHDGKHSAVDESTTCEWCRKILENTHKAIQNIANNEELVQSTLISGCKLLPLEGISSKCTAMIENYGTTVLSLMKQQRYDTLCQLMNICSNDTPTSEENLETTPVDTQSKMMCNVVVRATHDLHVKQQKSRSEIQAFLKRDCQQLTSSQLVQKCEKLIERHGNEIYAHVASNVELSQICDYVDTSAVQSASQVHCQLCTFVLATAKQMLDAQHTEDKVLLYIEQQVCARLSGSVKKSCQKMIDTNGRDLINDIKQGTQPMLLCTYFQLCLDDILDQTSPIQKEEMRSFLQNNLCEKLGSWKSACEALIEKDGTRLLQVLANEINGNDLCHMFGLCPKQSPLLDEISVKDDPTKCERCVKDFTRRKHIAERLVNHSSEFLHHLCGQLPQQDDCTKAVDDSINELLTFIRSLDPKTICVQLNMCDQKALGNVEISAVVASESVINEEIIQYIKYDICSKLGSLSSLCTHLAESEGLNLLNLVMKTVDPHRVCTVFDVCPSNPVFKVCRDKCQCCANKMQLYQAQLSKFMRTIVASTRIMCDHVPGRDMCLQLADVFESNVNKVATRFNSKQMCQYLNLCSSSDEKPTDNQCQTCQHELKIRQDRFRTVLNEVTAVLLQSCTDDSCRSQVQFSQQETFNQINKINPRTLCQHLGYCVAENSEQPSTTLLRLRSLARYETKTVEERLELTDLCSEYGPMKPMCEHVMTSVNSHRYENVYMALLKTHPKMIDDDLRAQMATKVNVDVCEACKNGVQSSKDFWDSALDNVRDVLLRACERCPSKNECHSYITQHVNNVEAYVNSIDASQFCQSLHLCSSSSSSALLPSEIDPCSTCVQTLQSRKEGLLRAVDRLAAYFDDVCQRFGGKQCQTFVQQIQQSFKDSIESYDVKQTCSLIGFCSSTHHQGEVDFETYEKYLEDELDKTVCSTMGPFESLCKQVIHGNRQQIETVKINYNIKDLMQLGEQLDAKMTNNFFTAANLNACSADKCQCCIDRVKAKKECVKNLGDKVAQVFVGSCDYCPAKDQCRQFWKNAQSQFDQCIDGICPKQVCTRLGFCNASTLCANMGVFQQSCEEALAAFTQSVEHDPKTLEDHLPHTSVVVLPVKHQADEKQSIEILSDSNATCILCEYMMNILATYIQSQSTEAEIEQSLQKVCDQMPSTLRQQCHDLVNNYGPPIIATLLRDFDVKTICRKLNLCTSQMKVELNHITKANVATCSMCDYVSTYIHFALKRDPSEKSLQHALSTVCTHLSNDQNSQCQTLVQLFAPQIRKLDLQLGNNFCKQLTICQTEKSETDAVKPTIVHVPLTRVQPTKEDDALKRVITKNLDETPECMLCHYVISYLDAALKNNKSEAAVEAALEKVCSILPSKERATCDEFVKTYGPVIAELIAEAADPDTVCRYLGVCQVSLPTEPTTKKPAPVTYGNHDYARLPSVQTPFTCTICQFVFSKIKQIVTTNKSEEEILAAVKESCDLFSVINLKQQCTEFLDQYAPYIIQMVASDVQPKVACQNLGVCEKSAPLPSTTRQQSTPPTAAAVPPGTYGKCVYGMSYWCTSRQNAILCNAVELCEREVWSKKNKNIII